MVGAAPLMGEPYCFSKQSAQQNHRHRGKMCPPKQFFGFKSDGMGFFEKKNLKTEFGTLFSKKRFLFARWISIGTQAYWPIAPYSHLNSQAAIQESSPLTEGNDPAQPRLFYSFQIHPGKAQFLHPYCLEQHLRTQCPCGNASTFVLSNWLSPVLVRSLAALCRLQSASFDKPHFAAFPFLRAAFCQVCQFTIRYIVGRFCTYTIFFCIKKFLSRLGHTATNQI